jgi:hypothetical protein
MKRRVTLCPPWRRLLRRCASFCPCAAGQAGISWPVLPSVLSACRVSVSGAVSVLECTLVHWCYWTPGRVDRIVHLVRPSVCSVASWVLSSEEFAVANRAFEDCWPGGSQLPAYSRSMLCALNCSRRWLGRQQLCWLLQLLHPGPDIRDMRLLWPWVAILSLQAVSACTARTAVCAAATQCLKSLGHAPATGDHTSKDEPAAT